MPIVDVEIVVADPLEPGEATEALTRGLAEDLGTALGSVPGGTWVRLRTLPAERYAENGEERPDPLPVFVTIRRSRQPEGEERKAEARRVADRVAARTGRPPGRIHVLFEPDAEGRIAFGGRLD